MQALQVLSKDFWGGVAPRAENVFNKKGYGMIILCIFTSVMCESSASDNLRMKFLCNLEELIDMKINLLQSYPLFAAGVGGSKCIVDETSRILFS